MHVAASEHAAAPRCAYLECHKGNGLILREGDVLRNQTLQHQQQQQQRQRQNPPDDRIAELHFESIPAQCELNTSSQNTRVWWKALACFTGLAEAQAHASRADVESCRAVACNTVAAAAAAAAAALAGSTMPASTSTRKTAADELCRRRTSCFKQLTEQSASKTIPESSNALTTDTACAAAAPSAGSTMPALTSAFLWSSHAAKPALSTL
jgi:hypothetical protein